MVPFLSSGKVLLRSMIAPNSRFVDSSWVQYELIDSLLMLGQLDRRLEVAHETKELAEVLGDTSRLARALAATCNALTRKRQFESGYAASSSQAHLPIQIQSSREKSCSSRNSGAYTEGAANLRRSIRALRVESDTHLGCGPFPSVFNRHLLVVCLTELGELDEATLLKGGSPDCRINR